MIAESARDHFCRFCTTAAVVALLVAFAPVLNGQSNQPTVKVVDHIWGFDGRVQPGQFNPISILLDNQTDEAVEVVASLRRVQGIISHSGGDYVQKVFLAATTRRWIQFYPYITNSYQIDWQLHLDDVDDEADRFRNEMVGEFNQTRAATKLDSDSQQQPPQVVILDPERGGFTRPTSLKHLPENIFPPYATATFGLHTVFLDHVPDWELPRQQAFHSWLKLGGRLHLLKNRRGEFPNFSGDLADLNQPLNRYAIGSGIVIRHDFQREDVTEDLVRRSVVLDVLQGELDEIEKELAQSSRGVGRYGGQFMETEPSSIDESIFQAMRELTFPDHNWWLIFLLALCYIGLIFPGCFILSKNKQIHFLATYGGIIGLSIVFSLLFLIIGRRGYGESTTLQTLAIARAEDDTNWSVFQWNALFVTSGNVYDAGTPEQQSLFSTANTMDKQDVVISPGNKGHIRMQIPPFSSQTFVSRRRITSDDWKLQLKEHNVQASGLVSLSIQTGSNFPSGMNNKYMVLAGRRIYEMDYEPKTKRLKLMGKKRYLAEFCQSTRDYGLYVNSWARDLNNGRPDNRTESEIFYDESLPDLIRRSLLDDLVNTPSEFELPGDRIRVFVFAELPEEFTIQVSATARSTGRVLFTRDLFLRDLKSTEN